MEIDHGGLQFGVSEEFLDGVYVYPLIKEMRGKAMSKGMGGETAISQARYFHTLGDHMPDGAFVHGAIRDVTLEEIFFRAIQSIISSKIFENEPRQDREPIFVPFSLHDFDLHGATVDTGYFEQTQFIEPETGAVEESDHAAVLDVFDARKEMLNLGLCQDLRKLMFFPRKELRGEDVGFSQDVFVEEAEALCCHPTLVASERQGRLEVIDVQDDVILRDGEGIEFVEVGEEKSNFGGVVAHGSFGISSSTQRVSEFDQQRLCRGA